MMIVIIGVNAGCSGSYSYIVKPDLEKEFVISPSTKYYIRKLYLETTPYEGNEISEKATNEKGGENLLTEVQFLFINGKDVVYVTTKQSRFIFDKTGEYLINDQIPNAYFFDGIYFGKIVKDEGGEVDIDFESHKRKQKWTLNEKKTQMDLNTVDEFEIKSKTDVHLSTMKIEYSFKHPFIFQPMKSISEIYYLIPDVGNKNKTDYIKINKFVRVFTDKLNGKLLHVLMPTKEKGETSVEAFAFSCAQVPFFIQ